MPDPALGLWRGNLAESFELPDDSTQIWHIRKGVYFHNKLPVNGREMVANDVAFSIERVYFNPASFHGQQYPPPMGVMSTEATDKWMVVVKTYPNRTGYNMGNTMGIIPPSTYS